MSNAIFSANNYGSKAVTVVGLTFGINIVSSEGESRNAKALYTRANTEDAFSIDLIFSNYGEFDAFGRWLQAYGARIADPNGTAGPMRIVCPARDFDKTGIPTQGLIFGDRVGNLTYPTSIQFVAASDVINTYSQFKLSEADASIVAPYFYPGGSQLSGNASAPDSVLYDAVQASGISTIDLFNSLYGGH